MEKVAFGNQIIVQIMLKCYIYIRCFHINNTAVMIDRIHSLIQYLIAEL